MLLWPTPVRRCRAKAEGLCSTLHLFRIMREEAAGKRLSAEVKRLRGGESRKRRLLRKTLAELGEWDGMKAGSGPRRYTDEQVTAMLAGESVPWVGTITDVAAAKSYWGRRYHYASADLARTREEQGILKVETQRVVKGLKHFRRAVGAYVQGLTGEEVQGAGAQAEQAVGQKRPRPSDGASLAARHAGCTYDGGVAWLLRQQLQRVAGMLERCEELTWWDGKDE